MKSSRCWGSIFLAIVAAAGCTASGPADDAQLAVAKAIDCARLGSPVNVEADASANVAGRTIPLGRPLNVRLRDLRTVSASLAPGRKEKRDDRFAGLVPFRADSSGAYTVLVASVAWADLVEASPPRIVEPRSFEWIEVCGKRYKSGLYSLEAGTPYFVQLWDSPDRELAMMIRRLP